MYICEYICYYVIILLCALRILQHLWKMHLFHSIFTLKSASENLFSCCCMGLKQHINQHKCK